MVRYRIRLIIIMTSMGMWKKIILLLPFACMKHCASPTFGLIAESAGNIRSAAARPAVREAAVPQAAAEKRRNLEI